MPIVIDGNNLLHSLSRQLSRRTDVRRFVLEAVRHEHLKIIIVFDGPPPSGSPPTEHLGQVAVRYSGAESADEVILSLLPKGKKAFDWSVVSDDRELCRRARERGAGTRSLREWRNRRSSPPRRSNYEPKLSSHDVADWEEYFADRPEEND